MDHVHYALIGLNVFCLVLVLLGRWAVKKRNESQTPQP
jgi:hypothetical protein